MGTERIVKSLGVLPSPATSVSNLSIPCVSRRIDVLNVLLAVEEQKQETAKESLDSFARWVVDHVGLEFLRPKVRERLGKGIVESAAEHNEELEVAISKCPAAGRTRNVAFFRANRRDKRHTAMSGLSSNAASCGGEGDRLRGGGEGSFFAMEAFLPFASLGKNFRMPFFFGSGSGSGAASDSMSDGTGDSEDSEDKSDESSSAIIQFFPPMLIVAGCVVESWMGVGIVVVEVGGWVEEVQARWCMSSVEAWNAHRRD